MTAALLKLRTRGKPQGGGGPIVPLAKPGQIGFNMVTDVGQGGVPSFMWLNRMKSGGYNGVWNNGAPLSQYGYPTALGTGADTASFIGLRRPTSGTIRYVFRHNGAGLMWNWAAQNITIVDSSNPNRVIFDVGTSTDPQDQAVLSITGASTWPDYKPGNPIATRDGIAIYELSEEAGYLAGKQFSAPALAAAKASWGSRWMEVLKTNNSLVRTEADRTPVGYCVYSAGAPWGPPLEALIDLANEANSPSMWVNIPYAANLAYKQWMLTTLRDRLNANVLLIVETANEPWNFGNGFQDSFTYYRLKGEALGRGNPQGYGYEATLNAAIARDVFSVAPSRLFLTLNLQADSLDNYEGVAEGVSLAGGQIGKTFDSVSVAMYTSGGAQDLGNFDYQGSSAASRQLLLDETARYEATGPNFASRTVRRELIAQMRHGNVIPGWPNAITLDGVQRQAVRLAAFCRKYGIRHATVYEMQDFHTYMEALGLVDGLRVNLMFTAMQNDPDVSGTQAGSYERDRFQYLRSNGITGTSILTDVGPVSMYGAWRTKDNYYSPDTRLWDFYEWYNVNAPDQVLFEINVSGITDLTVGRLANIRVSSFGGLVPTKTRFPTIKSGTLPAGLTYQNGDITGRGTTQGPPSTVVFAAYDASGREILKSVTINMGMQAVGKRFLQFSTDKNLASLAEIRFKRGSVLINTAGWVPTGDQFSATSEGVVNLIDGDLATIYTGKASGGNTMLFDTGDGNAVMPDTIEMVWRADIPDRAPLNFTWKWGDTSTALTTIATVTGATYPGGVCTVTPSYS